MRIGCPGGSFLPADEPATAKPLVQNKSPLITSVGRSMAGTHTAADIEYERNACLDLLTKVRNRADIRQLIAELEKSPTMQLSGNRRQRRTAKMQANGRFHVAEVYSPPRMTEAARAAGLKDGWSLDLTKNDENGEPWDLSKESRQKEAMKKVKDDKPFILVASPMCAPLSALQEVFNYPGMETEEVRRRLEDGLKHVKFALELCLEQYRNGRLFLLEHPAGASTWSTEMIANMEKLPGVEVVTFDFCTLGMKAQDKDGEMRPAKKRTSVITNSSSTQLLLREAQCHRQHRHVKLLDGRAKACEIYPEKFCRLVCEGVKQDMVNAKWRDEQANIFDITTPMGKLLKLQEEAEKMIQMEHVNPPEEDFIEQMYEGLEFVDDVSGEPLEKDEAIKARKVEIKYFKDKGVYTKVKRQAWMTVISTKWLDVNKGDSINKI